jgi:hypothetical protein
LAGKNYYYYTCLSYSIRLLTLIMEFDRFSDRDLLMRYHWGLGVGHLHSHQSILSVSSDEQSLINTKKLDGILDTNCNLPPATTVDMPPAGVDAPYESDNPELGMEDRDSDGWSDDVDSNASQDHGEDNGDWNSEFDDCEDLYG